MNGHGSPASREAETPRASERPVACISPRRIHRFVCAAFSSSPPLNVAIVNRLGRKPDQKLGTSLTTRTVSATCSVDRFCAIGVVLFHVLVNLRMQVDLSSLMNRKLGNNSVQ